MNTTNLMYDKFYARLIWHIENKILDADKLAQLENIQLTDSNVKSSILKARNIAKKGKLKSQPKNRKEEILFDLAYRIDELKTSLKATDFDNNKHEENSSLSLSDWLLALRAVEDSIKLRATSGGRVYLEFIKDFIKQGKKTSESSL